VNKLLPALLILASFGSVLTIAAGVAMSRSQRASLDKRLSILKGEGGGFEKSASDPAPEKAKPRHLARVQRILLLDTDHPWELKTGVVKLVFTAFGGGIAGYLTCRRGVTLPTPVAMLAACLCGYYTARTLLVRERNSIEAEFAILFPDTVDAIGRMLRAGLPVTAAFQTVCQEAPPPVSTVFETLAGQLKIGMPIEDAVRLAARRVRHPDFQFFAAALLLQRSAGGNLLPTLEALSQLIRSRRAVVLKARAVTAEVRLSAYILGALPFFTIGALLVISPGYLTPLFTDPRGKAVLAAAIGGLSLSAFVMRRMLRGIEDA
jgi:tight adherence protein B